MNEKEGEYMSSGDSTVDDWNLSQTELSLEGMDNPFKDKWRNQEKKYYSTSNYGSYSSYKLKTLIVKANDDLR